MPWKDGTCASRAVPASWKRSWEGLGAESTQRAHREHRDFAAHCKHCLQPRTHSSCTQMQALLRHTRVHTDTNTQRPFAAQRHPLKKLLQSDADRQEGRKGTVGRLPPGQEVQPHVPPALPSLYLWPQSHGTVWQWLIIKAKGFAGRETQPHREALPRSVCSTGQGSPCLPPHAAKLRVLEQRPEPGGPQHCPSPGITAPQLLPSQSTRAAQMQRSQTGRCRSRPQERRVGSSDRSQRHRPHPAS